MNQNGATRRFVTLAITVGLSTSVGAGMDNSLAMPATGLYVSECGGCHTAYAPVLLPARSWHTIMAGLERHFGTDASLDAGTRDQLLAQLVAMAADGPGADRLVASHVLRVPSSYTPLRTTETPFFSYMHEEMPSHIWRRASVGSKANCVACHPRADEGRYFEREVKIPK